MKSKKKIEKILRLNKRKVYLTSEMKGVKKTKKKKVQNDILESEDELEDLDEDYISALLKEEGILKNVDIKHKIPQYKVYEQVRNGNIKIFSDNIEKINNNLFMLKISGIWETETHYGITYKFSKIGHP